MGYDEIGELYVQFSDSEISYARVSALQEQNSDFYGFQMQSDIYWFRNEPIGVLENPNEILFLRPK